MKLNMVSTDKLSKIEKLQLFELWNSEYPAKLAHKTLDDFNSYLEKLKNIKHILLVDSRNKIHGWYFDFIRNDEKWFVIILDSAIHKQGNGTKLLNNAKKLNTELNGWVIDHDNELKNNDEYYVSPLKFYAKNGFQIINNIRLELDNISAVKINWKNSKYII